MSEIVRVVRLVAIFQHRSRDRVVIPDLRIPVSGFQDFRDKIENFTARFLGYAEADVRIGDMRVRDCYQKMPGQLILDRFSLRVASADHEARRCPRAHIVHILQAEAVDKLLRRLLI